MKSCRLPGFDGALAIRLLLANLASVMLSGAKVAPEACSRAAP